MLAVLHLLLNFSTGSMSWYDSSPCPPAAALAEARPPAWPCRVKKKQNAATHAAMYVVRHPHLILTPCSSLQRFMHLCTTTSHDFLHLTAANVDLSQLQPCCLAFMSGARSHELNLYAGEGKFATIAAMTCKLT